MKTKLRQFRHFLKHDLFIVDNITVIVTVIACLAFAWSTIMATSRNWELAQELLEKRQEEALLELEVATLELENEYYASEEYQELAARSKQHKKLPGETVIYLSDNSEYAKNKHKNKADDTSIKSTPSNFNQWLQFLFGL